MPWNIAKSFWPLLDKPVAERPLFPFNAEPIEEFVAKYKGARDVPLFQSKLVVPVIYINNLPEYLKDGSPFLRYLRETKVRSRYSSTTAPRSSNPPRGNCSTANGRTSFWFGLG